MLNKQQIKLIQTAVRGAGLRSKNFDGRYRLLLAHYKRPDGRGVTSCKQLNNSQLEDLLAICEAHGWRCPGRDANHFRRKVAESARAGDVASFAQQSAVKKLAEDLGWDDQHLCNFVKRMTGGKRSSVCALTAQHAYAMIEALKAIFGKEKGVKVNSLQEVESEVMDGEQRSRQNG